MPIAFPTAEGFGRDSVGGRGGTVLRVTNGSDSGTGSFRAAVTASGPRIVVFDYSGTITIQTQVTITQPYLTIAGQTSPGGVQIRGTPGTATGITFGSGCHDVIVRHLRVRIGGNEENDNGESLIIFSGSAAPNHCYNMIFDHCSVEWGHDGQMMVYGNWDLLTWQWCISAKPIYDVSQSGGREGMHIGGTSLDMTNHGRITLTKCAFIHCNSRIPNMTRARIADQVSNFAYNWSGNNGSKWGQEETYNWYVLGNFHSNRYKKGPNSGASQRNNYISHNSSRMHTDNKNWGYNCLSGAADDWVMFRDMEVAGDNQANEALHRVGTAYTVPPRTVIDPANMDTQLLPFVGAYKPTRDSVDTQYINEALNGTGAIATTGYSGGPWPDLATGAPAKPTDTNNDGISDAWAVAHGFSATATIANTTGPGGWTYIEHYINELAGDPSQIPTEEFPEADIIQVGATSETASGSALTPTISNVAAGNTVIYVATSHLAGTPPTIGTPTENGGWEELVQSATGNNQRIAAGYLQNVAGGTYTPTITLPAGTRGSAVLIEVKNLRTNGAIVANSNTYNTATPATPTITPPTNNPFVLAAISYPGTSTTITQNAAWNLTFEDETTTLGPPLNIIDKISPTGTQSGSWTLGSSRQGAMLIVALEGTGVTPDVLSPFPGTFTLTGRQASFLRTRRSVTSVGTFTLTGNPIAFKKSTRTVTALTGLYAYSGKAIGFIHQALSIGQIWYEDDVIVSSKLRRHPSIADGRRDAQICYARIYYTGSAWIVDPTTDSAELTTAHILGFSGGVLSLYVPNYAKPPVPIVYPVFGGYASIASAISFNIIEIRWFSGITSVTIPDVNMDVYIRVIGT